MSLKVLQPGLWSSIQDQGRFGYAAFGVPVSGVMDSYMAAVANLLVGNTFTQAVMEITMNGPVLEIQKDAFMAFSALNATLKLNEKVLAPNKAFRVRAGDQLEIKRITEGVRGYLAVKGGFKTNKTLESRSFYKRITKAEKLQKGVEIPYLADVVDEQSEHAGLRFEKERYQGPFLAFKGPEWNKISRSLKEQLLAGEFHISSTNSRMAYQLQEKLKNNLSGILTQPVIPGTIQLTPAGNLIILMRDCQTTGGYPRILQLSAGAINQLAQLKSGDSLGFKLMGHRDSI